MNDFAYRGRIIEVRINKLKDGLGWSADVSTELHSGDAVTVSKLQPLMRTFDTYEKALDAGRRHGEETIDAQIFR